MFQFKIGMLVYGFCYLSVWRFFGPNFRVSAWCLKGTKPKTLMVMLFSDECMWEQKISGLKKLGERVVSQAVVKIVMTPCVL